MVLETPDGNEVCLGDRWAFGPAYYNSTLDPARLAELVRKYNREHAPPPRLVVEFKQVGNVLLARVTTRNVTEPPDTILAGQEESWPVISASSGSTFLTNRCLYIGSSTAAWAARVCASAAEATEARERFQALIDQYNAQPTEPATPADLPQWEIIE